MRTTPIAPGEYYHIFNRSNDKQPIFYETKDWVRFLFLILHMQSPEIFYNIGRNISKFVRSRAFNINGEIMSEIIKNRTVELVSYALMPNHFHLTVKEVKENGISQYMQRVLTAYPKYFNTKYNKSGHLFQGPYKIVHTEDNKQLLYLSAYIHKNPRELKEWRQKEHNYPWSSYQDYVGENRWGNLLSQDIILDQFENKSEYYNFVKTNTAKMLDAELLTF
ncbi:hypothetical protein A3G55_00075 [Candidatus Giovannonibacteria bacterium RIFCSPLOWO2_12_FULL_44_25]|uniref:Transposase IS200-like domain-containing protein n=4 Tax=Parcubacteria group TaxID=1794811 RepID=A0A0G1IDM9_9BACT|nr:MAG: hypothetical protein UW15_C0013G0013 [Parcubacteria group bacterium GW2011_GWC1_44_10]KKT57325.1 MAG: hypothetical protein UW49_C0005G0013 [Candidatus Giovannonibacteria bacterium GW2011_GWB1_44_23]KKT59673.1 MAG: hypothetical protein UW53_C0009G0013 [Candidatus Giovannonibacteria bacterium GW2011_GWA1_44_25]OGF50050.1 MAG: hypothetical protein A2120_02885 [Candidatus Giovannonibacteria bacterium GWA2_45_15]OGF59115.1 MAG: hypothetical protein A2W40_01140 [Candidatus Giovannonibacteria 